MSDKSAHQYLAEIQKSLNAPKGQHNKFGNYSYRNCEDILTALKPLLGECTITLNDEIVMIGDRFYVKATATLTAADLGTVSVSAYAREDVNKKGMDLAQITGSTSSYARKYALNGLFAIDDTKDADSMDNTQQGAKQPAKRNAPAPKTKPLDLVKAVSDFMKLSQPDRDKAWDTLPPELCTAINKAYANAS